MKISAYWDWFVSLAIAGSLLWAILQLSELNYLKEGIRGTNGKPSFYLDDQEWSCAYTERQVKINILEEELSKLKQ